MKDTWKNLINILVFILLIMQPFLEIFYLKNKFMLFGFQLNTLIRLLIFGMLSILLIWNFKNLKYKKVFIFYVILCLIYFFFHHINSMNFKSLVPGNFNYSLLSEIFYLLRMLIPVFLMYYVINSDFVGKIFSSSLIFLCVVVAFTILITNIFKVSICSYSDELILGNIFDWFRNPNISYMYTASRGLFSHITIFYLVILISPYIVYLFYKCKNKWSFVLAFLLLACGISAMMAGSKSTSYGIIIILVIDILMSIFFMFVKPELKISPLKILYHLFLIVVIFLVLPYSPVSSRKHIDDSLAAEKTKFESENKDIINEIDENSIHEFLNEEEQEKIDELGDKLTIKDIMDLTDSEYSKEQLLIASIRKNYINYGITPYFIETSYPYFNDPYFWKELVDNTQYYERSNNRMVVERIYNRVLEINNNRWDKWFGFTHTRAANIYNLERDFIYQYYSMGIIGLILLLGPYLFVIFYAIIKMLVCFKEKLTYGNCSILLGISLVSCLAFYSGNTLENLAVTMPLGIMCGVLLKHLVSDNRQTNKKDNK